jgi:hypothetical protein
MATIRVPAPPPEAFRKDRPISDLVKSQIKHFQHLEHKLQLPLSRPFSPRDLTTEAGASQYIAEVTAALCGRTPVPVPVRATPASGPDSTPPAKSARKPAKATRQSQGLAIAASAGKKRHTKKHAAKHSKKKS